MGSKKWERCGNCANWEKGRKGFGRCSGPNAAFGKVISGGFWCAGYVRRVKAVSSEVSCRR